MKNFTDYLLKGASKNNKKIFVNGDLKYFQLKKLVSKLDKNYFSKFKKKLIGISINTSENFLFIYLSIIKSGNIAVLIEKGFSENRYEEVCKKFKLDFFITDKKVENNFFSEINNLNNETLNFFRKRDINLYQFKSERKNLHKNLVNVALVLFTSGSSGEKKGVMLSHLNLISNTESILKILPIKKRDIVNLILPTTYSFGLSILNTHLKKGASIFLHNSPFIGSIIKEIKTYKCTSFYGVPSSFEILVNKTNFINNKFYNLRYIAQAGGNLSNEIKKKLVKKFKNKVFIMYGATEASPRLSYVPPKILHKKINSIGRPLPGVKFKLNKNNSELAVKGKNIMKGYLFDQSLTKNKIKKKFFLTGDIAYKDEDGYYYIKKRKDKIIKRFGFKINLNFIEKKISKVEGVKFAKLVFNKENELILLTQSSKNMLRNVKKNINQIFSKKFTSYEYPDKIIISCKKLSAFNKKLSVEEIYDKFQHDKNVSQ